MELTLITAFTLGLSTSLGICLFSCLPVYLPLLIGHTKKARQGLFMTLWFVLGRFSGYFLLGIVAFFAGRAFNEVFNTFVYPKVTSVLIGLFGLFIIIHGLLLILKAKPPLLKKKTCANFLKKGRKAQNPLVASFLLGFVSTLSYCLSVAVYLLLPFALGNLVDAVSATVAFGIGANVIFVAIGIPLVFGMELLNKKMVYLMNPLKYITGSVLVIFGLFYVVWASGPVLFDIPTSNFVLPTLNDLLWMIQQFFA